MSVSFEFLLISEKIIFLIQVKGYLHILYTSLAIYSCSIFTLQQ